MTDSRGSLIDFGEICRQLNAMAGTLARELLPRGTTEGPYWVDAKKSNGGLGDSLKVDTRTGKWRFFSEDSFGDMLDLYCLVTGESKTAAIKWARDRLGLSGTRASSSQIRRTLEARQAEHAKAREERERQDAIELERRRAGALGIFLGGQRSLLGTPAGLYLEARGIDLARLVKLDWGLHCLRFVPSLMHPFAKAYLPALVAQAIFPDGRMASLHRTYLVQRRGSWDRMRPDLDGHEGKLLYCKIQGGVVPIWRGSRAPVLRGKDKRPTGEVIRGYAYTDPAAGPDIDLIEGIENGLTVVQLDVDRRVGVAVSLSNACQLKLPDVYTRRTWIRDNDAPGSRADELLERALDHLAEGADECFLVSPPAGLKDFNDGVKPNTQPATVPSHGERQDPDGPAAGA